MNIEKNYQKDIEVESLNATYDSIDLKNKDMLDQYRGEFNRPKPKFRGMPEEYYPTTPATIAMGFVMILPLWIFLGLTAWGAVAWGVRSPKTLGWTNFFVFLGYLSILLILIYFGSAQKRKYEREGINLKIIEKEKKKKIEQEKQEEYRNFLKQYQKQKKQESRIYQ